jgi:thiamine transport system permease protein
LNPRHRPYNFLFSGYLILVVILPLAFLCYDSFFAPVSHLFVSVIALSLKQSLLQASLSTLIAVPLGLTFGILLIIYAGRWKNVIISLLLITYVMPGLIMALGIISLFGYSSRFYEIIYGNVIYNAPMIAVLASATGSITNPGEINSARILGAGNAEIISRFYLRNSLKGALLGGLISFLLSFEGFSLPLIIGGPSYSTLEVMIYEFKRVLPSFSLNPFSNAALLSMIQIATLAVPLYFYISIRSQSRRTEGRMENPMREYSFASLIGLIAFLILVFLPFISIVYRYPPWTIDVGDISARLNISLQSLIYNTIFFSFASTFFAFIVSIFLVSRHDVGRTQFLIMLPLIFSPVTLALSYFLLYGTLLPMPLLIILIFTIVIVPLNIRMMSQSVESIPPSEIFSSRVMGDSSISSFFKVQLPRISWELSTIISLMFITVMGEFSSIATVYTASTETLTIGIYQLLQLKDIGSTYGLTEVFLIVIFISSFVINHWGKRGLIGQN